MSKNKAKGWKGSRITLLKKLIQKPNGSLLAAIGKQALKQYSVPAKPQQIKAVVVLVLNPLDALGDNQVLERTKTGFTVINLTKLEQLQRYGGQLACVPQAATPCHRGRGSVPIMDWQCPSRAATNLPN
ncbi:ATP-dependent DNA helicase sgs1 [Puccinia graminis f. sp. tritici]|uniref:ATP-dependent DNA helicase sgs1 n=1 Tax=Puccinia graminis f. sp. tritici TaxID=56615 RepID=A0A5B0QGP7_PUCGR|nr:ATP-dependent DNA helicase sgs1 [Puccinia graminis f. sp. tritici]